MVYWLISLTDPNEEALELATPTDPVVELLKQGAGEHDKNITLPQKAMGLILEFTIQHYKPCLVLFKVHSNGISTTLTL